MSHRPYIVAGAVLWVAMGLPFYFFHRRLLIEVNYWNPLRQIESMLFAAVLGPFAWLVWSLM